VLENTIKAIAMAMATYLTYKDMRELHFLTNWV